MPRVRIAVGCHPHNAKFYDDGLEADLRRMLKDPRVAALGEIGLDYHYDFSPCDDQREAFRRQLRLAKEAGLPVVLHLREAHDEALAIMREEGFPEAGTLLHCFNLDWATLEPWVEAPYMTPEPMRGMTCLPDHVLFTAERLAEACGRAPGAQREEFLARLMDNARELLDRPATAWQKNKGA